MRTILCLLSVFSGCASEAPEATPDSGCDGPCEHLSEYGLFTDLAALAPAPDVYAYHPAAELWSDNAHKSRFLRLPEGETVTFGEEEWGFPEGALVVKHFAFPADLRDPDGATRHVETRILQRTGNDWDSHVYLWNEAQDEAERFVAGKRVPVSYLDEDGILQSHDYIVPNTNQCQNCHERDDTGHLLGLVTPQVADQLEPTWFDTDPGTDHPLLSDPFGDAPVDQRARAWLHANCAHCHRAGGLAGSTGLDLTFWNADPHAYGVCREPVAAGGGTGGLDYDIVPGAPEQSILVFRMQSDDPDEKMPELPNLLVPEEGVALVSAWIAQMEGSCP